MLLQTDDGMMSVRMIWHSQCDEFLERLAAVVGQAHVVLLVDGFEFGVESADNRILEAVCLNLRPVLDLVGRDVLDIGGFVARRPRIRTAGTDCGHEFVVFVRNGEFRRLLRHAVDLRVDCLALRIVGSRTVNFEQTLDFVEQRFLGCVILRTELLGTLEHQMFEIVSQTGRFGRVVLRADTDGNKRLHTRFLLVHRHVDFKSVVESIDTCGGRVARHRFRTCTSSMTPLRIPQRASAKD